jgi:SAM-dependent methyltransferase
VKTPAVSHHNREVNPIGRLYERSCDRLRTAYWERKLGVSTGGFIEPGDLGIASADSMAYTALGYEYIFWALRAIPFPAAEVVLLDYGSGKGRVLAAAATRGFARVLGVEISAELADAARRNLARMKHRQVADAQVHHADAAGFAVPADVNVIWFFNPFAGATLTQVLQRISASVAAHPRNVWIVFFNHAEFDKCVEGEASRGSAWLRKVSETPWCGVYRTTVSIV